ncbi:MAG: hypothetical protein SNJ57_16795 [Cyanobacteriota bacterium]
MQKLLGNNSQNIAVQKADAKALVQRGMNSDADYISVEDLSKTERTAAKKSGFL